MLTLPPRPPVPPPAAEVLAAAWAEMAGEPLAGQLVLPHLLLLTQACCAA